MATVVGVLRFSIRFMNAFDSRWMTYPGCFHSSGREMNLTRSPIFKSFGLGIFDCTNGSDHPAAGVDTLLETGLFGGLGASLCSDMIERGGRLIAFRCLARASAAPRRTSFPCTAASSCLIRSISSLMKSEIMIKFPRIRLGYKLSVEQNRSRDR